MGKLRSDDQSAIENAKMFAFNLKYVSQNENILFSHFMPW